MALALAWKSLDRWLALFRRDNGGLGVKEKGNMWDDLRYRITIERIV